MYMYDKLGASGLHRYLCLTILFWSLMFPANFRDFIPRFINNYRYEKFNRLWELSARGLHVRIDYFLFVDWPRFAEQQTTQFVNTKIQCMAN